MLKIVLDPPPRNFFFSGIEDFAALGAYIIDYIRVLVPNGVYLTGLWVFGPKLLRTNSVDLKMYGISQVMDYDRYEL